VYVCVYLRMINSSRHGFLHVYVCIQFFTYGNVQACMGTCNVCRCMKICRYANEISRARKREGRGHIPLYGPCRILPKDSLPSASYIPPPSHTNIKAFQDGQPNTDKRRTHIRHIHEDTTDKETSISLRTITIFDCARKHN